MLNLLVPTAEAARAADLNVSTPAIRQLTQSMEERHARLKKYYDSGAVGLTARWPGGECAIRIWCRCRSAIPRAQAGRRRECRSRQPVSRDRDRQRSSGMGDGYSHHVRRIAGRARPPPGWFYQDKDGTWKQK